MDNDYAVLWEKSCDVHDMKIKCIVFVSDVQLNSEDPNIPEVRPFLPITIKLSSLLWLRRTEGQIVDGCVYRSDHLSPWVDWIMDWRTDWRQRLNWNGAASPFTVSKYPFRPLLHFKIASSTRTATRCNDHRSPLTNRKGWPSTDNETWGQETETSLIYWKILSQTARAEWDEAMQWRLT